MEIEPVDGYEGLFLVRNVYDSSLLDEFLQEDFRIYLDGMSANQDNRYQLFKFPSSSKWKELLKSADYSSIFKLGYFTGLEKSTLWIDEPKFYKEYHVDNDSIDAIMQVYLKTSEINCGTTFIKNNVEFTVPYIKNCGYFNLNKLHRLEHGVFNMIDEQRYSICNHFTQRKRII